MYSFNSKFQLWREEIACKMQNLGCGNARALFLSLGASLSRFTLVQPGLDWKVGQTGLSFKFSPSQSFN